MVSADFSLLNSIDKMNVARLCDALAETALRELYDVSNLVNLSAKMREERKGCEGLYILPSWPLKKEVINMKTELKKIECGPSCGFMARSHNEKELIDIALDHAKKFHKDIKVTEKDVKAMIKSA